MHTSQGDPPPDAPEYNTHVLCEHKHLAINAKNRRLISESVRSFELSLYSWY